MRVVDGEHQRSMVGQVDCQPVESMQDGKACVLLRAACVVALKKRNNRPCWTSEQRVSFVRGRVGAATFEELAGDAEGKVSFEIGSARPQHDAFLAPRDRAGGIEHRGLADARARFDQHDSTAAHEGFDCRHLRVAFNEVGHAAKGYEI